MARRWVALLGAVLGMWLVASPAVGGVSTRTERLVQLLANDGSYRVRLAAAQSLGRLGGHEAVRTLIHALEDDHPLVRAAAASSLGRIGSPEALRPLKRLLDDASQPPEVVSQVRDAITLIRQGR